ncbi:hypothetical protein [Labilibacter marinus]|uniref:hypothetical protein n=1 Tax=Labilibacter marinus TaxID=1477105 RepID=UPI00094F49EB|nr:hypothetical protein [Labilibacter marinus]
MQTLVHTPSIKLEESIIYYKSLGYEQVNPSKPILSDGKFLIEINPNKHARVGIKIIKESWQAEIEQLNTEKFEIENGYLIRDNNGVWIYLIEDKDLKIDIIPNQKESYLGKFMGISIETTSFEKSIDFWSKLGFVQVSGAIEQGWVVIANADGFAISFMLPLSCPHSFTNPSMTFFNGGNNLENIAKIKEAAIPIKEEITAFNKEGIVDNVIIQDPGEYAMFIFND